MEKGLCSYCWTSTCTLSLKHGLESIQLFIFPSVNKEDYILLLIYFTLFKLVSNKVKSGLRPTVLTCLPGAILTSCQNSWRHCHCSLHFTVIYQNWCKMLPHFDVKRFYFHIYMWVSTIAQHVKNYWIRHRVFTSFFSYLCSNLISCMNLFSKKKESDFVLNKC